MKNIKLIHSLLIVIFLCSCSRPSSNLQEEPIKATIPKFPERAKNMNIYEVNIRQYTPEGTFNAFVPHIGRLKKMGVDILWIMPIQLIGLEKRKGDLGSYYSIKNYTEVNPEHGTLDDFKTLVKRAHEFEMLVILDWVANHTAWDHHWITEQPDFYTKDSLGNIISPEEDWSDVADLNYENEGMQHAMIEEMKFWIDETDLDGFRCDVAGFVPMPFWNKAKDSLNAVKNLFMLAEWDDPKMHKDAFHMSYGWDFHHVMNEIAKGSYNADSIQSYLTRDYGKFDRKDFRMHFTSNHDENSWNGTVYERMGEGHKTFAVLAATLQGMPLIYSGQEAGLNKRLSFFGKDSIDWSNLPLEDFYATLLKLKKENEALWNGEYGGEVTRINTKDNTEYIYAFSREKGNNRVIVILNLSGEPQNVQLDIQGTYKDVFTQKEVITSEKVALTPWEYLVFTTDS